MVKSDEQHKAISIHAPREGGDRGRARLRTGQRVISIHAPREGGDDHVNFRTIQDMTISIHAPREGGDFNQFPYSNFHELFQSTPPARGATADDKKRRTAQSDFNPRPPRGGRLREIRQEQVNT